MLAKEVVMFVKALPLIAGRAPDKADAFNVPFTLSTKTVESSANTEPLISFTVFVTSSSAKLSLIFLKAVLNGSPSPLFAPDPMLIP